MRVDVYTRHDAFIKSISSGELIGFVHTDELNGSDSVEITTTFRLCEGYRLIWKDRLGRVHEHVCQDPKAMRAGSGVVYTDTALNSICELMGDYIDDKRPYGYSFRRALEVCLEPTRWQVGTVDQSGTVSDGLTFYHTDCRSALNAILECGGELETDISVASSGTITRKVGIRQHRGETGGHRRFEYGKDLTSISRTEHWGAITACYGYGKGLETESGGYGRKLTFGDINGGRDYVADSDALKAYGRPDGKGGYAHVFGKYENSQCEDAQQLKGETQAYLDAHKEPGVTYEANVVDLVAMGRAWEGVGVGDDVQIVDACFEPVLRCEGRVSKLVTDLLGETCEVTLGNVTETLSDIWERQQGQIDSLSRNSSNWDVAATTPGAYLQQIIDGLNEQFNTQGMSYCFTSFEQGTIWSSVPLDENGRPTKTGGSAIQICSQGFRIASGTKSDGSYNWRTFGTGDGFTADEITAGTIRGGSNMWNLDTGDLSFKQGSITINGPSSTQVRISASDGFKVYQNGSFIGGIEVVGGKAHLRAARAGTASSLYVTTGQTQQGNPGASFVNSYGNYLDVEALRAEDDSTGKTTGAGMACFNRPWMNASTYYNHLWLHPPIYDDTYLQVPPEQLYIGSSGNKAGTARHVTLQLADNRGLFINDSQVLLRFDATHWVKVDAGGVQCRCGSNGFGWLNGKFVENLVWG